MEIPPGALVQAGRCLSSSLTGGCKGIKEMLAFAAEHRIEAKVEVVKMSQVNEAMKAMREHKPRFRYVMEADFELYS